MLLAVPLCLRWLTLFAGAQLAAPPDASVTSAAETSEPEEEEEEREEPEPDLLEAEEEDDEGADALAVEVGVEAAVLELFSASSLICTMRQEPSKTAPFSMTRAGCWLLPVPLATRPISMRFEAVMSPLTVPKICATATSTLASTRPLVETMSVPSAEETRPESPPSTRSMPLKLASPVRVVPLPTKPVSVPSLMSRASDSDSVTAREVVCV